MANMAYRRGFWSRLIGHWEAWRARRAALNAPPRLAATLIHPVRWDSGKSTEALEEITFMLMEDSRGRRSYRVHDYGYCRTHKYYEKILGPVLIWQAGGVLPPYAVRNFSQQPARLTVVK